MVRPVLLYSTLTGLSIIPASVILTWIALELLSARVWDSGWALLGVMFLLVAAQAVTLAGVSIITKHSEMRLAQEIRNSRESE
jgi:hypothetical protein